MLQYDDDEDIAEEAQQQWEEKNLSLSPVFYIPLFQLLGHSVDKIRNAASSAIAHGLLLFPKSTANVLTQVEKKCEDGRVCSNSPQGEGTRGDTE